MAQIPVRCPRCSGEMIVQALRLNTQTNCIFCASAFLPAECVAYEPVPDDPPNERRKAETVPRIEEQVYYERDAVRISSTRATFGSKTFALAGITSVESRTLAPKRNLPYFIILVGAVFCAASGILYLVRSKAIPPPPPSYDGLICLLIGLPVLVVGAAWARSIGPTFAVILCFPTGERKVFASANERESRQIVGAINQTMSEMPVAWSAASNQSESKQAPAATGNGCVIASLVFIAVAAAIAVIIGLASSHKGSGDRPNAGERGTLRLPGGDVVLVAISQPAHDRLVKLAVANDKDGLAQMMAAGLIWTVPSGTTCHVLESGVYRYEVRISEGEHRGEVCFVASEWVFRY